MLEGECEKTSPYRTPDLNCYESCACFVSLWNELSDSVRYVGEYKFVIITVLNVLLMSSTTVIYVLVVAFS